MLVSVKTAMIQTFSTTSSKSFDCLVYACGQQGEQTIKLFLEKSMFIGVIIPEGVDNDEIIKLCATYSIPCLSMRKGMNGSDFFRYKVLVSSAYSFRISSADIEQAEIAAVNIHASILPLYKGKNSDVWALINGEKQIGITLHLLDSAFDSGDILKVYPIELSDSLSNREIYELVMMKLSLVIEDIYDRSTFTNLLSGAHEQPGPGIYWRRRTLADSRVCWHMPAKSVFYFVRGLSRAPIYAFSTYNGKDIMFGSVSVNNCITDRLLPGTITRLDGRSFVACGEGSSVEIIDLIDSSPADLAEGAVLH